MTEKRPVLWRPTKERADATSLARYIRWLEKNRGLTFADYPALWEWSVSDLPAFWSSMVEFFEISFTTPASEVIGDRSMPGTVWFKGATLNFADQILKQAQITPQKPAIICQSETFGSSTLNWGAFGAQVASVAMHLKRMGVGKGDRVVAVLPNTEVAMVAMLASVSLGAVWSLCAPDMGHVAILDRFKQIEPKVLIAQDGYVHAGKINDRRDVLATIVAGLPSLLHKVLVPVFGDVPAGFLRWDSLTGDKAVYQSEKVAFDHPLWIVYSSGTTGNPKPIVHGHGGALLEGVKQSLHQDLQSHDRFCWMTSSGWIMWNTQFISFGQGATVAMFDGAVNHPDLMELWRFVAREKLSYFGAGAAFFTSCQKAGLRPGEEVDLSNLRSLGATGSPLTSDGYDWVYDAVKSDIWLAPISGGTDLAGAFVCGNPMAEVRAGEMQCRALGNAVRAFDETGNEVFDAVGELVCTEPLPSMPLFFWGDAGNKRLIESYFDTYPGIWRHGDWIEITPDGRSVIYGRSDATINRRGLRMGSAEIYQAVEGLPEINDSLVVDLEFLGRDSFMPLFVVVASGVAFDDALKAKINMAIKTSVSARFQPSEIIQITEVPRTISGKKLEVPVKKLLLGGDAAKVVNRDSMANPASFDIFIDYAKSRA